MIEFKGLGKIEKQLSKIQEPQRLEKALEQACALVEAEAKKKAPKGSGALRRSIASRVEGEGEDMVGIVFTPLEYAPYVEYGTGLFAENGGRQDVPWNYQDDEGNWHSTCGMQPQPYLRPALDENREDIIELIKEGLING